MSPPLPQLNLNRQRTRRASIASGVECSFSEGKIMCGEDRERSPMARRASWPRLNFERLSPTESSCQISSPMCSETWSITRNDQEAICAELPPRPILKSAVRRRACAREDAGAKPPRRSGRVRFGLSVLLRHAAETANAIELAEFLSSEKNGIGRENGQETRRGPVATSVSTVGNLLDVDQSNHEGVSLLHLACFRGNVAMVQMLLRHGANPNVIDWDGWTPLHAAVHKQRMDLVVLLVGAGAVVPPVQRSSDMAGLASVTRDEEFIAYTRRLTDRKTALDSWRVLQALL